MFGMRLYTTWAEGWCNISSLSFILGPLAWKIQAVMASCFLHSNYTSMDQPMPWLQCDSDHPPATRDRAIYKMSTSAKKVLEMSATYIHIFIKCQKS